VIDDCLAWYAQIDFCAFICAALKSNKIGRVGAFVPLEGHWMLRGCPGGWGRRRSTMERTNQQTGMHRPWGDFCVYRSALTPGAESECGVQRVKGMRENEIFQFFVSLSLLFLQTAPPFFPSYSLFAQSRFGPAKLALRIGYLTQPLRLSNYTRNLS